MHAGLNLGKWENRVGRLSAGRHPERGRENGEKQATHPALTLAAVLASACPGDRRSAVESG
jgi:hypothetical protein